MTARTESRQWSSADTCPVRGCDELSGHNGDTHVQFLGSLTIPADAGGYPSLIVVTREGPSHDEFEVRIHVTTPRGDGFVLTPDDAQVKALLSLLKKAADGKRTW